MRELIDLEKWDRKDHFLFYSKFKEPYNGVVVDVDVTALYQICKAAKESFFLAYLHAAIKAVNQTEAFRYRIVENQVYLYHTSHVTATIARDHGPFAFSFIEFTPDFEAFKKAATAEIQRVKSAQGLDLSVVRDNIVHFSTLPWFTFKSLSHARDLDTQDCSPKITFGKTYSAHERLLMPVSIHVHHGFVYGEDVADFISNFQQLLDPK